MSEKPKTPNQERFEGKVANIIDNYRVVINKGSRDGVRVGQRFLILTIGEEVQDPDTKESLGRIEVLKGKGEVTHVQEKMATLQTTDTHEIKRQPSGLGLLAIAHSQEVTKEPKEFINPEIGDIARLLQ